MGGVLFSSVGGIGVCKGGASEVRETRPDEGGRAGRWANHEREGGAGRADESAGGARVEA